METQRKRRHILWPFLEGDSVDEAIKTQRNAMGEEELKFTPNFDKCNAKKERKRRARVNDLFCRGQLGGSSSKRDIRLLCPAGRITSYTHTHISDLEDWGSCRYCLVVCARSTPHQRADTHAPPNQFKRPRPRATQTNTTPSLHVMVDCEERKHCEDATIQITRAQQSNAYVAPTEKRAQF